MNHSQAGELPIKNLGLQLKNQREIAGKTPAECAQVMGVSESQYMAYEAGDDAPALPQIEACAYYLEILPETILSARPLVQTTSTDKPAIDFARLGELRRRMIGVSLQRYRREAGLTLEQLAALSGIPVSELERYEFGETHVPLPQLEAIARHTNHTVYDFLDRKSQVGLWAERQRMVQEILNLPVELRDFISKPVNRPYLELAQRLSEMPAAKLRAIAEGLLEITL